MRTAVQHRPCDSFSCVVYFANIKLTGWSHRLRGRCDSVWHFVFPSSLHFAFPIARNTRSSKGFVICQVATLETIVQKYKINSNVIKRKRKKRIEYDQLVINSLDSSKAVLLIECSAKIWEAATWRISSTIRIPWILLAVSRREIAPWMSFRTISIAKMIWFWEGPGLCTPSTWTPRWREWIETRNCQQFFHSILSSSPEVLLRNKEKKGGINGEKNSEEEMNYWGKEK